LADSIAQVLESNGSAHANSWSTWAVVALTLLRSSSVSLLSIATAISIDPALLLTSATTTAGWRFGEAVYPAADLRRPIGLRRERHVGQRRSEISSEPVDMDQRSVELYDSTVESGRIHRIALVFFPATVPR